MTQVWKPTQYDEDGQPLAYGWADSGPDENERITFADGSVGTRNPDYGVNEEGQNVYDKSGWKKANGSSGGTPDTHRAWVDSLPKDNGGGLGGFIRDVATGPIGMAIGAGLGSWLSGADSAFTGGVNLESTAFNQASENMMLNSVPEASWSASSATPTAVNGWSTEGAGNAFDFSGSNTPMADRYLDSAGNFGQPFDVNTGGQVFDTGGLLDASTIGTGASTGGWQSGIIDSIKSGLGNINQFLGMDKNPITLGDIGKTGANFLISSLMANRAANAASQAGKMGSALDQPQRQGYQAELQTLMSNPSTFYSTNPVVQAQLAEARKQFEASSAKMGTGGTQQDAYLKNLNNIFSGTFNDQANLLSGLGGFNQGPGGGGAYANLMTQSNVMQNQAFRGFGERIFKQDGPQQGQTGVSGLPGAATPA